MSCHFSTPYSYYRSLIKNYLSEITELNPDYERNSDPLRLTSIQRAEEFFNLSINKRALIVNRTYFGKVLILPPNALKFIQQTYIERVLSNIFFIIYLYFLSTYRTLVTFYKLIKIPSKFEQKKRTDCHFNIGISHEIYTNSIKNKYKIINWFSEFVLHKPAEQLIFQDAKNNFIVSALPWSAKAGILIEFIPKYLLSVVFLFMGRWESLYLFDDNLKSQMIERCPDNALSRIYVFCYQGTQYRPLWTWTAEDRNCRIIQFYNSACMEPSSSGRIDDFVNFEVATWPEVIPFNQLFIEALEKFSNFPTYFHNTPTIFIKDMPNEKILQKHGRGLMCIFDVTPQLREHHIGTSSYEDYFLNSNMSFDEYFQKFYSDCVEIADEFKLTLMTKPKIFNKFTDKNYIKLLENLERANKLYILPSNISPYRIMDHCELTVSQPFTSTGYYKNSFSKNCFYDLTSSIKPSHEALVGTDLCVGKNQLRKWVSTNLT